MQRALNKDERLLNACCAARLHLWARIPTSYIHILPSLYPHNRRQRLEELALFACITTLSSLIASMGVCCDSLLRCACVLERSLAHAVDVRRHRRWNSCLRGGSVIPQGRAAVRNMEQLPCGFSIYSHEPH